MKTGRFADVLANVSLDDLMVLLVVFASVLCAAVPVVDLAWLAAA